MLSQEDLRKLIVRELDERDRHNKHENLNQIYRFSRIFFPIILVIGSLLFVLVYSGVSLSASHIKDILLTRITYILSIMFFIFSFLGILLILWLRTQLKVLKGKSL
ncbi:hypothetical protein SAMN06272722_110127 [Paenibacillus sp. RU5A]|nr:hypothetical protein SAMN06272722_110127 [Paenibacillus sp. RU5A]SOC74310.1 hypothetical protein SAMN05880581_110127 [Paenibacillus sp. RU26A]SOC76450.1 hypothetical protein SAMN05880586_110127 [Paenibacillus sp. RU5M]